MSTVLHRPIPPACLDIQPLDDAARDGAFQLVFGAGQFAVAKWDGPSPDEGAWRFANGHPLNFQPEGYRP